MRVILQADVGEASTLPTAKAVVAQLRALPLQKGATVTSSAAFVFDTFKPTPITPSELEFVVQTFDTDDKAAGTIFARIPPLSLRDAVSRAPAPTLDENGIMGVFHGIPA